MESFVLHRTEKGGPPSTGAPVGHRWSLPTGARTPGRPSEESRSRRGVDIFRKRARSRPDLTTVATSRIFGGPERRTGRVGGRDIPSSRRAPYPLSDPARGDRATLPVPSRRGLKVNPSFFRVHLESAVLSSSARHIFEKNRRQIEVGSRGATRSPPEKKTISNHGRHGVDRVNTSREIVRHATTNENINLLPCESFIDKQ